VSPRSTGSVWEWVSVVVDPYNVIPESNENNNEACKTISVCEDERIDAEFVTNGWPEECQVSSGTYKPGDKVRADCRVKNTGSAQARFVVVFKARTPDGRIYSITSDPETILPGRRHTYLADQDNLLLTIPADAPGGSYDVRLEVQGYNTGKIYDVWPTSGWRNDQFKVEGEPVPCADTVVKGEIISEPVYSPFRHFDLRIDEVIKNENNIPAIVPGQNIFVFFSSALDQTVESLQGGDCVEISGTWEEDTSQYLPGLDCDPESCSDHSIQEIPCTSVAEIKFMGIVTEPDNQMLDDAFDCKVKVEEILENPSGIAINEGDEVIVHKWIWCGQWQGGLTDQPGGKIIPEDWSPAEGDKVELYGGLSEEHTSIPGHSEASYLLNLCGSDQYYLKRLTPPMHRALIIAPFYTAGKMKNRAIGYSKALAKRLTEAGWFVKHLGDNDNEEVYKAMVLEELKHPYDLIHITTHGGPQSFVVDPSSPSARYDSITAQDIEHIEPFSDGAHPLVYLAYCWSNDPEEDGLMPSALVQKGASACVGFTKRIYFCDPNPEWDWCRLQGDRSAYDVARDFYDGLADGQTVGQAIDNNCGCSANCPCNGNYDSCLKHTGLASVTLDIPSTGGADSWIGLIASVLGIRAFCPIDLSVVDPEGFVISKSTNAILEATYIEADLNGDGDPDDQIIIPNRKAGGYQIRVIPEERAFPIDRYTLEVSDGLDTIVLADYVRVGDIPEGPYVVKSTAEGISAVSESETEPEVPTPTPAPTPSPNPKQGMNLSMLIAIVAGTVALVAIVVGVFLFLRSRYYI